MKEGKNGTGLYKEFPPGLGLLKIPVDSRAAALAGLAMYAPCARRAVLAQRAAWHAVSALGVRALPGRAFTWTAPMDPEVWSGLRERWAREIGTFDNMVVYERVQIHRPGLALLLMRHDEPIAFVKLRRGNSQEMSTESNVLDALASYGPTSFFVPRLLTRGDFSGWHYLVSEPFPALPHRVPTSPPLKLIVREIQSALSSLPRPEGTPDHWRPMHGDLTPWNLREITGHRCVLTDWEEAGWGPPGADEVLYRATAAALHGEPANASKADEAISYWETRIRERPVSDKRDHRLEMSLARTLDSMRTSRPARRRSEARPRVLVFAYACEPRRGSEPGAGWGLVRAVERFADCTVLVGPEHTSGLRDWQRAHPGFRARFVEVPEPPLAGAAKHHRLPWFLLYQVWLRRAHRIARGLHEEHAFDATYHATYATYWLPTPATDLGVPCVWGPVGGAVTTPVRLWPALGFRGILDEVFDLCSVAFASLLPPTRRVWRRAAASVIQNEETLGRLPRRIRARAHLQSHVHFIEMPQVPPRPRGSQVLWFSPLEARKGPRLALHALSHAPEDVHLVIVGDGPERRPLERLSRRLGLGHRITFRGYVPREQAFELMSEAACVLFTNLREEGGVALAEAMFSGAAVVVLANGGIRETAVTALDPSRVRLVFPGGLSGTARRLASAITEFSRNPPAASSPNLDTMAAVRELEDAFEEALGYCVNATASAVGALEDPVHS